MVTSNPFLCFGAPRWTALAVGCLSLSACSTTRATGAEPALGSAHPSTDGGSPSDDSIEASSSGPSHQTPQGREFVEPEVVSDFLALDIGDLPSPLLWRHSTIQDAPLIVSAHGAGGTPEWHCDWWSGIVQKSAFVLCLRGKRMGRGVEAFYYPEHHTLGAMFDAATANVYRQYGHQLDLNRQVYVAYSQGATMGALMMLQQEEVLPNLLLIEGGYNSWTAQRCARFAERGGRKVFFACGTQTCNQKAVAAVKRLETAGVRAKVAYAAGAGHTPAGQVGVLAKEGLAWLLDANKADQGR